RQKQKKRIMLPSETMIWQPEFTDKTLSRKPGAVHTFRCILPAVLPVLPSSEVTCTYQDVNFFSAPRQID
ncbi:hypothetical protein PU50_09645, partial [Escherichia coli]|uniref:hypothetical protein n=1 Tax=Escherichia coli TaxID=562 RepID=UPI00054289FA